jgi:hypothetical protein
MQLGVVRAYHVQGKLRCSVVRGIRVSKFHFHTMPHVVVVLAHFLQLLHCIAVIRDRPHEDIAVLNRALVERLVHINRALAVVTRLARDFLDAHEGRVGRKVALLSRNVDEMSGCGACVRFKQPDEVEAGWLHNGALGVHFGRNVPAHMSSE